MWDEGQFMYLGHKNRLSCAMLTDTSEAVEFDIGTNSVYLLEKFVTRGNSKSTTCRENYN